MQNYDIIGDVHGCASLLEERLIDLGYRRREGTGAYRHEDHDSHRAIFVGDLIDRGPQQLETLELVKAMVDTGSAQIVMGNHEFNAIAYATENPENGEFLRAHNKKNTRQHQAFLDQLTASQQKYYVEWFKTMPLWLDLDEIRVIHACWHEESMSVVQKACEGDRFTDKHQLVLANDGKSKLYEAVERLLKGPEIDLAAYELPKFKDKGGDIRGKARNRWWKKSTKLTDIAELSDCTDEHDKPYRDLTGIEAKPVDQEFSYTDSIPVFYGHYWRENEPVEHDDFTDYTACVDFSAVKNGKGLGTLVAYRWNSDHPKIARKHYRPPSAGQRSTS